MSGIVNMVDRLIDRAVGAGDVEPARAVGLREMVRSGNARLAFDFLISHLDDTEASVSPDYFAHVVLAAYKLDLFTEADPVVGETDVGAHRVLRATIDRVDENVTYD
ncbi:MAG TPA: hypothetical protein H9881_07285 [Candidatus Stackebrandtia excrementipullorum]|nr:hypothetical protein [Candidatus Stackebrandtia excrementipullorum]